MNKITKKQFIDLLVNNKSEFISGGYIRNKSFNDILEHLQTINFNNMKGETRQGFKHSNGLKFLKNDGTYSYLNNLVNYNYYQMDNIIISIREYDESNSLLVYRIITRGK